MSETKCYTVYSYDELSEESQEKAVEELYQINVDFDDWSEYIIDDAKTIGALIGIDIDRVYFSGFYSQGDGACFEGSYAYKKGGLKALIEYAPQATELHRIARGLQAIQRPHFYKLTATIKHNGHYYHEGCTLIDVYDETTEDWWHTDYNTSDEISELLRDFMHWIYRTLEQDYEWATDREQVEETIRINDYQFKENGTLDY
jgi:hypothetical protein